jgi:hypothetical protein
MTISLGRRFPGASSSLPGSRHGSGRSAGRETPRGAPQPMLPYLALLQVGFTEPGRSPDLLVSSYLTVSPLPRGLLRHGGLFSVALSLPGDAGRWVLPTTLPCGVRTFLRNPPRLVAAADHGGHPACHDPSFILAPFTRRSTRILRIGLTICSL